MQIPEFEIEEALVSAAKVIDGFGYIYYPLFERLETELTLRETRASRIKSRLPSHNPNKRRKKRVSAPGVG